MTDNPKVLVLIGSSRAKRIGPLVAQWVAKIGGQSIAAQFEIIDLKDWPLPVDEEPEIPATGKYANAHTQAWSRKIQEGDAFVIVSPQYNWGYPAPLKNALDHLYKEWSGKPVMIATYGGHGGGKCAAQLRQVLEGGLDMKPVATMPGFKLPRAVIEANPGVIDPATLFAPSLEALQQAFDELAAAISSSP